MIDKILIANRGEVAVRIIRTARRMGIATVVVYSDADKDSLAVEMADESVRIGPAPASESYLLADRIVEAVRLTKAQAVHPGFGFLSENAGFARRLADEKIIFIGPNPDAIAAMGDKIESKRRAAEAGVSTVPGYVGEIEGVAHAAAIADDIGYPVMIKASAGGGGKGIRVAHSRADVEEGFPAVKAEARNAFGDDRVFIEKFITDPRHIEIQVMGDKKGNVVHLFERECSIQRRNQKVIEEAPSPLLDAATREAMGAQAVALSKAVGYDSAGTVEFVVSGADKSFYFLEMNTRLQVEHPVTEMITGLDLVELMIRVAAGEKLPMKQKDVRIDGWAVESRIYAEDPYRNFLPSIGRLKRYRPPQADVRLESGVREGDDISMFYDPMIAKLVTHGPSRLAAIDAQVAALDQFVIEGPATNIPFLSAVMEEADFRAGGFTTGYIKAHHPEGFKGVAPTPERLDLMIAAATFAEAASAARAAQISGTLAPPKPLRTIWAVTVGGAITPVAISVNPDGEVIAIGESAPARGFACDWRPGEHIMTGRWDEESFALRLKRTTAGWTLDLRGATETLLVTTPRAAALLRLIPEKPKADLSRRILSPMPGLVLSIEVAAGQAVKAGDSIAIVEAMKMQNIIRAERDGTVQAVFAATGASVAADEILVELS